MRPLNRPMFRYGGPIKEGVMNGIKEPRQNYQEAGRVRNFFSNLMKPALNADGTPVTLPNRNFVEDLTFVAGPGKFLKAGGVAGQQYAEPAAPSPFSTALSTALGVGGLYGKIFG